MLGKSWRNKKLKKMVEELDSKINNNGSQQNQIQQNQQIHQNP